MKKYICFIALFVALGFSGLLHAADFAITICKVQTMSNSNNALIAPCGGWTSKNGCVSGTWLVWDMSVFGGKAIYSTALTAFTTGETAMVRLNGLTCIGSYDATTMIRIQK